MRVLMIGRGRSIALRDLERYWGEVEVLDTTRSLKPPLKRFDLVVAQEPLRVIGLLALLHSKLFREKLVYEVHGDYIPHVKGLDKLFMLHALKSCFAARAVNKTIYRRLQELGVERILYVPGVYVDTELFKPLKPHEEREGFLLYVGRFSKEKNLPLLLRSFKVLSEREVEAKLVLVGRGEEYSVIQRFLRSSPALAERVKVVNEWLPQRELVKFYCEASAFVSTSIFEGGPRTIFEACACETPFISTPTGVVLDYAEHGREGFIVDWREEEVAEYMAKLLSDVKLRRAMGERARRLVLEHFEWSKAVKRYAEAYLKLVES